MFKNPLKAVTLQVIEELKIERLAGIDVNGHGAGAHGAVRRQMNMMRVSGTLDFSECGRG